MSNSIYKPSIKCKKYLNLALKYNNDTTLKYNVRLIDTISSNVEKT